MNRRGNGLDADSYAPLVDLAPHLADAMLDALRDAGVAAYAAAAAEPETTDPDTLDRLYVDTDMRSAAEGILQVQLTRLTDTQAPQVTGESNPGPGTGTVERDEDAIWAEIVASYDAEPQGDDNPWPDQENVQPPKEEGEDRSGRLPLARVIKPADEEDTAEAMPPADDDGHYIPPPPPPLPAADPVTKAAWIALVGGPLYLLITVILNWDVPGWAAFVAVAAFIGGFVTLVLRMGDDPRDTDDGAVI